MNEYFKEDSDGSLVMDIGAKTSLIEESLAKNFDFFFSILENADKIFALGLEKEFENISKRDIDLINKKQG